MPEKYKLADGTVVSLPDDWSPSRKAAAIRAADADIEAEIKGRADAKQKRVDDMPRTAFKEGMDRTIAGSLDAIPGGRILGEWRKRTSEPGTLTRDVSKALPTAAGMATGGAAAIPYAGAAAIPVAAALGAAGHAGREAMEGRSASGWDMAGEGAKEAAGQAVAPIGRGIQTGTSALYRALTGITKKADADRILGTWNTMTTRGNAARLQEAERVAASKMGKGVKVQPNQGIREFSEAVEEGRGHQVPISFAGLTTRAARPVATGVTGLANKAGRVAAASPSTPPVVAALLRLLGGG